MIEHTAAMAVGLVIGLGIGVAFSAGLYTRGRIDGAAGLARHLELHGWYPMGAALCTRRWMGRQGWSANEREED